MMYAAIKEIPAEISAHGARFYLCIARDAEVRPHWEGAFGETIEEVKASLEASGLEFVEPGPEAFCDVVAEAEWNEPA